MSYVLGVKCKSCKTIHVSEIDEAQVETAKADTVIALRALPLDAQAKIVEFWQEHVDKGHFVEPTLCEIEPLPQKSIT